MSTTFIVALIIAVLLLGVSAYKALRDVRILSSKLKESVGASLVLESNRDFGITGIIHVQGNLKLNHQNFNFKTDPNFTADIFATLSRKGAVEFIAKYSSDNKTFSSKSTKEGNPLVLKYNIKDLHNLNGLATGYIVVVTAISEAPSVITTISTPSITIQPKPSATPASIVVDADSEKMFDRFKTIFLTNVNHEIRTPLNTILGFTDLLMESDNQKERSEYKGIIKRNSELLLKYIDDILDLSRIEADKENKPTRFDIKDVLGRLADRYEQEVAKGVKLSFSPTPEDAVIVGDKDSFERIVSEFLSNAVKHTTKGEIKVEYEFTDNKVNVSVSDTGLGIEESRIPGLFNCFLSSDPHASMGLTICKSLANKRGGEVGAFSTVGKGSTFWVLFPFQTEMEQQLEQATNPVQPIVKNDKFNLLIAEDNDSNFLLINSILKAYNVTRAENGQIAVDLMKQGGFDAVIMDIRMPIMDGIEATTEIRKFDKRIPIIALSAHTNDGSMEAALEHGCNIYLTKPINRALLCDTVLKYCMGQAS